MSMEKYFDKTVACVLIASTLALAAVLSVRISLADGPTPDSDSVAAHQPYRVSGSPHLRLPKDRLDWPPILAPATGGTEAAVYSAGVDTYDMATGEVIRGQTGGPSYGGAESGLTSTPPYQGLLPSSVLQESVLSPDDWVRISPTTGDPWRSIVKLFVTFPNGIRGSCSGAIIGSGDGNGFHVLTAGHCAYNGPAGDINLGGFATSIEVIPGLDGDYMPYNHAWVTGITTYASWTQNEDHRHDWALLALDRRVGNFTGWMGRETYSSGDAVYSSDLHTAGYPADKSGGLGMYYDADVGRVADEFNHWYFMDTAGGQSGSPVWRQDSTVGCQRNWTLLRPRKPRRLGVVEAPSEG